MWIVRAQAIKKWLAHLRRYAGRFASKHHDLGSNKAHLSGFGRS